MKSFHYGFLLLGMLLSLVSAGEVLLNQQDDNRQRCAGMYSRKSWGGDVDPFILVKFLAPKEGKPVPTSPVSLLIFEWKDFPLIGQWPEGEDAVSVGDPDADTIDDEDIYAWHYEQMLIGAKKELLCDDENIKNGRCTKEHRGEWLLAQNATELSQSEIKTIATDLGKPPATNYMIRKTGYYCVFTLANDGVDYEAVVEFRNSYGELGAAQIAKLPFYGGMTIAYAVMAAFWGFFYWQHRTDILAVQNYITVIVLFLIVEMLMTWLFYDFQNRNGSNAGSKALMIVVAVLNAARNSFSFFLLLIVCMGYGVVKPSLGKTMVWVRWLALAHFVFGLIYAIASLTITPESAGPIVLFVILPLAATLTAFYVWTLNSLQATIKDLRERKQTVKASMYKKLWYAILLSIIVIFGFFFFNSFTFAGVADPDFVPNHWKTRWFILDGWLNIVYFADVAFICYMWLPTANNRRFAMSDEIAQDDEGFEIQDFGVEGESSGDEEEGRARGSEGPRYDDPRSKTAGVVPVAKGPQAPTPAAQSQPSAARGSMEGEIFAVGDDVGGWSDSDGDEEDKQKLVPKVKDSKKD